MAPVQIMVAFDDGEVSRVMNDTDSCLTFIKLFYTSLLAGQLDRWGIRAGWRVILLSHTLGC